jgi:hypothetical protein
MTGQVLGSVHYMSPEQVSGDKIDGRSDLYSLGVVAFQALSGRLPFDNESASAVIVAHVTKTPPSLQSLAPHVPDALAAVVDRCLSKSPSERYDTGNALARALDEAWEKSKKGPVRGAALLSEKQAQAVWERAANLQAATASHPAPPVGALPASAMPPSLTSGIAMERVRESAVEAGISREHVERAAAELGLVRGSRARVDLAAEPIRRRPILTPLFAAPFRLYEESEVDGEISPDDYDIIVDIVRRTLGDDGNVGTFGKTLTWTTRSQAKKGRNVFVTIVPRGGRTKIRIEERLGSIAGGLYGGIVGGTASLSALAFTLTMHATHSTVAGAAAAAASLLSTFSIARTILGSIKDARAKQLAALRDELEAEVRASIGSRG